MRIPNSIAPICSDATVSVKYSYTYNSNRNDIYLDEAIKFYLKNIQNSCAPNTIYCYSRDLNKLFEKIGNIKMSTIGENVINNLITQISPTKNNCSTYSGTSLNRTKSVYRSFFSYCFKREYINMDLAAEIHIVKSCSRFTTAITQKEIISLLDAISHSTDTFSFRDKALFAVYAFTGIRKSEALALRISDYDKDSKLLHLPFVKRSSKNFQTIPSLLSNILDEYLVQSNYNNPYMPLFPGCGKNTYLSGRQACLSGRQVSNRFEKWKIISGIRKHLTIHSFRAAYASLLYKETKDPLFVSYALGHSSFNTTKKYIIEDSFSFRSLVDEIFTLS